jgi:hypothetical protein
MHTKPSSTTSDDNFSHLLVRNFVTILQNDVRVRKLPEPPVELKRCIVQAAQEILPLGIPPIPAPPSGFDDYEAKKRELERALKQVKDFMPFIGQQELALCILAFLEALPRPDNPFWMAPAKELIRLKPTVANMTWQLRNRDMFKSLHRHTERGARIAGEKSSPKADMVWPQDYDGPDIIGLYLAPPLQELFKCKVPFGVKEANRQTHQWIMAKWGAGKTTLLSAQIAADLERVARDECSIMVMDSQNTLVPDIARLKCFAPGQPMHDRLIYIEPSITFPPALNIFDRKAERFGGLDEDKQHELDMATFEMMGFFLSSLLDFNLTAKQNVPFKFILPAVLSVPDATLRTLQEFLKDDGWEKYRDKVVGLDPDVIEWFEEHYRPRSGNQRKDVYAESREEIYYRIEGIYADKLFRRMFAQPRKKLDLFEQLQTGKVILINTKRGVLREAVEPWGRFFIAQLLQAVQERSLIARGSNKPVYCYIDEAGDYIAREKRIATIFTQARKQLVSMIIAHHKPSDIKEPAVWEALNDAGIRVSPVSRGVFRFQVPEEGLDAGMQVPHVSFEKRAHQFEHMTDEEWTVVLAEQREKWCVGRPGADPRTPDPEEPRVEDVERPDEEDSFDEE